MDVNTFRKNKKLTHEQLGKMFGVTIRTAFNWAQKKYDVKRKGNFYIVMRETEIARTEISRAKIKKGN